MWVWNGVGGRQGSAAAVARMCVCVLCFRELYELRDRGGGAVVSQYWSPAGGEILCRWIFIQICVELDMVDVIFTGHLIFTPGSVCRSVWHLRHILVAFLWWSLWCATWRLALLWIRESTLQCG